MSEFKLLDVDDRELAEILSGNSSKRERKRMNDRSGDVEDSAVKKRKQDVVPASSSVSKSSAFSGIPGLDDDTEEAAEPEGREEEPVVLVEVAVEEPKSDDVDEEVNLEYFIGPSADDDVTGWLNVPALPVMELRKEYLKEGRDVSTTHGMRKADSILPPLPSYTSRKRYFKLPFEANALRLKKLNADAEKFKRDFDLYKLFEYRSENVYVGRKRKTVEDAASLDCFCEQSQECGASCSNRSMMIECVPGSCRCGDRCQNQRFQKKIWKSVEPQVTKDRGVGLYAKEAIPHGEFIVEYIGEVITRKHLAERKSRYEGRFNTYVLNLGNSQEFVDATFKGNVARFMNHSCDPNCETQKWLVNGEICVGLFAVKDIAQGEELTFDYLLEVQTDDGRMCLCGSENCRGNLGKKVDDGSVVRHKVGDRVFELKNNEKDDSIKYSDLIAKRYLGNIVAIQRRIADGEKPEMAKEFIVDSLKPQNPEDPVDEVRNPTKLVEFPPFLHRNLRDIDEKILERVSKLEKMSYPVKLRKSLMLYLPNV